MKNENDSRVLGTDQQKAQLIKEILIGHISQQHPPTLDQLARVINVNRRKMEEIFERRYGKSIYRYFQDLKMKRILRYVRESKLSLKEISEKFGYSDQSALTVSFRRKFGSNPSRIRNESKQ
jgi:CRISPR type III-B/RAMP module RAMP protein Cmr1